MRRKVVIFGLDDDLGCNVFAQLEDFCDVEYHGREIAGSESALVEKAQGADVICLMGSVGLTDAVLRQITHTRLVVLSSTGYDYVDVAAASRYDIAVCNGGQYSTRSVAEHQFALLLAAARKLPRLLAPKPGEKELDFSSSELMGLELYGKTLGVIGAGAIGSATAVIARGFGMRVVAHSRTLRPTLETDLGLRFVTLGELLAQSDVITLNVPLTAQTHHLLGPAEFAQLKPGAIVVNASRGSIVDEAALVEALRSGRVAAAGLDVLEDDRPDNPLRSMQNVIITPHVAWLTRQSVERQANTMVENILAYFMGEPQNVVNKVYYNPLSGESLRLRPTLGNQVSLDVCQVLLASLDRLGLEPYRAGQQWVEGLRHRFSRGHVEEAVLQLRELMRDARLGLVRPVRISDEACEIKLEESIRQPLPNDGALIPDGASPGDKDKPVCEFEAGVMAGVFQLVLGQPMQVEMCQCELRGQSACHFTISPSAP